MVCSITMKLSNHHGTFVYLRYSLSLAAGPSIANCRLEIKDYCTFSAAGPRSLIGLAGIPATWVTYRVTLHSPAATKTATA